MLTPAKRAEHAYGAQSAAARTPRGVEYAVLSQITRRLKSAGENRQTDFPALAEALHENRGLWTALAANVADEGNALPSDLRARLIYLAEFTFHHTSRVLAREAEVRPLIEVNAAVMRGLLGQQAFGASPGGSGESMPATVR